MAELVLTSNALTVVLSRGEKVAGLHGDITVPLAHIRDVDVVADPFANLRGLRAPGLAVPGRVRIGTWRGRGDRTFVVARRGAPAVRVCTAGIGAGSAFDRLLVGTADATADAQRLRDVLAAGRPEFTEHETTFVSGDGTVVAGTLAVPSGGRGGPAAVVLNGSGEIDRDGDHRKLAIGISRAVAHALARNGVASLRYDKRGVGRSGGDFLTAGYADNRADAAAAVEWLRTTGGFARDAIAVIGHSEGACLATQLGADRVVDPAAVVLLAAPAVTGREVLTWQSGRAVEGLPAPVRTAMRILRIDVAARQRKAFDRLYRSRDDVGRLGRRRVNARWLREFLDYDPKPFLQDIVPPVLAITGAKDIQVDPGDLETIAALVPDEVDTARVPDLTHLLRRDPRPPSLGVYRKLVRQPVDAEVLALVADWTAGHLRR
ncbi:alpha/beta hydrolase family protein [Rhodococcus sp. SGAir0479]|uniref:alpha/beta hydrolase family protein n=1 Tax=Rhodococcus sp. SGAir0479 TaxID=2567884 RepID=UPI0010CD6319|nr:alpha/beta hydrolase [Rhodococcus sp. SGAir0479]QCQ93111.1 alpha/beta hydrolase [Rhodococcus sp. SGAir0479]